MMVYSLLTRQTAKRKTVPQKVKKKVTKKQQLELYTQ
jgi:hypothetical protein